MEKKCANLFSSICRLCLSAKSDFVRINTPITLKIKECTNVEVARKDGLPQRICVSCLRKLNNSYKFKKKCENSAKILKTNAFHSINSSIELALDDEKFSDDADIQNYPLNICVLNTDKNIIPNKSKVFSSIINNEQHIKLKTEFVDLQNEFSEDAENISSFKNHFSNSLKKTKIPTRCVECGKSYKFKKCLTRHMIIHHAERSIFHNSKTLEKSKELKKSYICSVCGKVFSQINNLNAHKRSHTGEKPFQCEICSKSFTQISNLYVHKKTHSDIREFKCQICPMDFRLLSHLTEHIKTHSDDKRYKCSSCGKGFHKRCHLQTHMRTHTSEKPFNCEHCGKSFNDSSNLVRHIRIHTGVKPFACNICSKSFAQKISMIKHQKKKHENFV